MDIDSMVPKLIRAGFEDDKRAFEVISISIANRMKRKNPKIAEEINNIICYKDLGTSAYRSIGMNDLPTTKKDNENLVTIDEVDELNEPILDERIKSEYSRFLLEQEKKEELMKYGIKASNTILLYGEPGVGKTYSAKWLAYKLNKPLINLNLATVVSSLLGETGSNIKSVLDYAKRNNGVLFLDEFDSIAKKRDDDRDVGELKRIVNVLLKELEQWPINGIVIAATNHPELLDKAIWRRFDLKINLPMPNQEIRYLIIKRELAEIEYIDNSFIELMSYLTKDINAAEIVRYCTNIKKNYILYGNIIDVNSLKPLIENIYNDKKIDKCNLCKMIKSSLPRIKVDDISELTGVPTSSIYRYLKNN
ncbi:ATP-binding protein [Clostridium perfringens]|uniref:AAA family ATPase n=1 Tax=Clostridium perfringens TaxID=1502 RepID=UPI0013E40825|nr:ATP-binding protein [Clostridium perfringens]EHK2354967.1 ATP-binding protein [Clostridium perfringens]MBI6014472.1 ATP-binding protein [Clostridium perfringens]MBO3421725.1 ATP-binding protein [Clostridium perfringens]MDK0673833.1 ATP-binding protein [Clostridium perfringens]MDK0673883.1 ATP-binding protein [Clostridium perfringens]